MNEDSKSNKGIYQFLIILASVVIIIAGIKAAASIVIPFLLATFITIIFSPPFQWLQNKKVPKSLALIIVIFSFLIFIMIIGVLIGTSINDFTTKIPFYE
ncbi:MAG: AI-2E family transporter, partial [Nitrososphaeraceae archaeon]|nr:AI-2E family transporter [Nitrososphaeraceae archaeon]